MPVGVAEFLPAHSEMVPTDGPSMPLSPMLAAALAVSEALPARETPPPVADH
jgi:hypothetical protein